MARAPLTLKKNTIRKSFSLDFFRYAGSFPLTRPHRRLNSPPLRYLPLRSEINDLVNYDHRCLSREEPGAPGGRESHRRHHPAQQ
jgi:hypothetical protein